MTLLEKLQAIATAMQEIIDKSALVTAALTDLNLFLDTV